MSITRSMSKKNKNNSNNKNNKNIQNSNNFDNIESAHAFQAIADFDTTPRVETPQSPVRKMSPSSSLAISDSDPVPSPRSNTSQVESHSGTLRGPPASEAQRNSPDDPPRNQANIINLTHAEHHIADLYRDQETQKASFQRLTDKVEATFTGLQKSISDVREKSDAQYGMIRAQFNESRAIQAKLMASMQLLSEQNAKNAATQNQLAERLASLQQPPTDNRLVNNSIYSYNSTVPTFSNPIRGNARTTTGTSSRVIDLTGETSSSSDNPPVSRVKTEAPSPSNPRRSPSPSSDDNSQKNKRNRQQYDDHPSRYPGRIPRPHFPRSRYSDQPPPDRRYEPNAKYDVRYGSPHVEPSYGAPPPHSKIPQYGTPTSYTSIPPITKVTDLKAFAPVFEGTNGRPNTLTAKEFIETLDEFNDTFQPSWEWLCFLFRHVIFPKSSPASTWWKPFRNSANSTITNYHQFQKHFLERWTCIDSVTQADLSAVIKAKKMQPRGAFDFIKSFSSEITDSNLAWNTLYSTLSKELKTAIASNSGFKHRLQRRSMQDAEWLAIHAQNIIDVTSTEDCVTEYTAGTTSGYNNTSKNKSNNDSSNSQSVIAPIISTSIINDTVDSEGPTITVSKGNPPDTDHQSNNLPRPVPHDSRSSAFEPRYRNRTPERNGFQNDNRPYSNNRYNSPSYRRDDYYRGYPANNRRDDYRQNDYNYGRRNDYSRDSNYGRRSPYQYDNRRFDDRNQSRSSNSNYRSATRSPSPYYNRDNSYSYDNNYNSRERGSYQKENERNNYNNNKENKQINSYQNDYRRSQSPGRRSPSPYQNFRRYIDDNREVSNHNPGINPPVDPRIQERRQSEEYRRRPEETEHNTKFNSISTMPRRSGSPHPNRISSTNLLKSEDNSEVSSDNLPDNSSQCNVIVPTVPSQHAPIALSLQPPMLFAGAIETSHTIRACDILFDTGSQENVLSSKIFDEKMRIEDFVQPAHPGVRIIDAQAQPLKIVGELSKPLKIKIKDTKNEYKSYILNAAKIVEDLPYPVLIGLPFIAQHDFIIRASQNLISCGSDKFIVKTNKMAMPILHVPAKAEEDVTVQPFQTVRLKITVDKTQDNDSKKLLYLFEPEERVEKKLGVNFTAAVISTDRPCIFVTNLDCCPITINCDSKIGSVRLVQPAVIQTDDQPMDNTNNTHVMALKTEPQLKINTPSENKEVVLPTLPDDMPADLRPILKALLLRYKHLFDGILSEESFGGVQHEIAIKPGSSPVFVRPYKYKPEHLPILRELMEKYMQEGIIEEATGAWCSPSFFVPKPHGGWRFVVDLRKLNEVIVRDRYQMPTVREIFDQLHGSVLFTSADGHSGFTQLCLHPDSRKYTGFSTPLGFFQYKRLPQGIVNGPPAYSREMARALHHIDFARNYVDDIIIHTRVPAGVANDAPEEIKMRRAWENHIEHLKTVFARCSELNIKLNPKKVIIGRKQIEFLGHIVSADGLRPSPKKIQAISTLKPPTDVSQLRKFLGMVNYYTAFIPRKAAIQQPLNKLLTKAQAWEWNETHQEAWDTLKNSLTTDCVRAYPDPTKPFVMSTDASGYAIANILSQPDDPNKPLGPGKVIEYNSRTMTDAEKNYTVHEQELLSVIVGFHTWTQYLLHAEVHVITDHASLKTIISWKQPSARIIRWRIKLADFNYTIHYRKGSDNAVADALSRLPSDNITNMISNSNGRIPTKQERLEAEAAFDREEDYLLPQIVPAVAMITSDPFTTPSNSSPNIPATMLKIQQVLSESTEDIKYLLRRPLIAESDINNNNSKLIKILSNLLQMYNQLTINMVKWGYPIIDHIVTENFTETESTPLSQTSANSTTSHQSLITDYYPVVPQSERKRSKPTDGTSVTSNVLMMTTDSQRHTTRLSTGSINRRSFANPTRRRNPRSVLFQDTLETQPQPFSLMESTDDSIPEDVVQLAQNSNDQSNSQTVAQTIDQLRTPQLEDTIENLDEGYLPRDNNWEDSDNPQPTTDEFAVPEMPESPRIDHTDDAELMFYDTNEMNIMRKYIGQEFFDNGILFKLQDIWQDDNGDCFGLRVPVLIPLLDVPEHVTNTILPLDYFISRLSTNTTEDLSDIIHNRLNDRYLNEVLDDVRTGIEQGRLRMSDLCYIDAPGGGQHVFRVYRDKSTNITYYQFFISSKDKVSQQLFLQYCHDHTGHFGVNKTLKQLLMRVYWIGIHDSVQEHIRTCRECQERKGRSPRAPTIPILRHPIPMTPCERWSVDIVGPFPRSSSGNNQALLAVCHMSKFMIGVPMPNKSAPTVLHAISQNLFYVYGDSNVMLTDRAQELSLSHLNRDVFAQFNIFNQRTASYSPWMNGQVERLNAVIEAILSKYCENEDHSDWDIFLASAVFAHNTTVSSTTGFTPYFMLHGREAKTTLDRIYPLHIHEKYRDSSHAAYARALIHRLKEAYAHCAKNIDTTQSTYNKPEVLQDLLERTMTNKPFFKIGDLVMMRVPSAYSPGNSRKLTRYWSGPFVVTKELNPTYFQIANNKGKHNASAFKLKKFELREPFKPVTPIQGNFRDNLQEKTLRKIHYRNLRNRRYNRDSETQTHGELIDTPTTTDTVNQASQSDADLLNDPMPHSTTTDTQDSDITLPPDLSAESSQESTTESTRESLTESPQDPLTDSQSENNDDSPNKRIKNYKNNKINKINKHHKTNKNNKNNKRDITTNPEIHRPITRSYRLTPNTTSVQLAANTTPTINCILHELPPLYVENSLLTSFSCVLSRDDRIPIYSPSQAPAYQVHESGSVRPIGKSSSQELHTLAPLLLTEQVTSATNLLITEHQPFHIQNDNNHDNATTSVMSLFTPTRQYQLYTPGNDCFSIRESVSTLSPNSTDGSYSTSSDSPSHSINTRDTTIYNNNNELSNELILGKRYLPDYHTTPISMGIAHADTLANIQWPNSDANHNSNMPQCQYTVTNSKRTKHEINTPDNNLNKSIIPVPTDQHYNTAFTPTPSILTLYNSTSYLENCVTQHIFEDICQTLVRLSCTTTMPTEQWHYIKGQLSHKCSHFKEMYKNNLPYYAQFILRIASEVSNEPNDNFGAHVLLLPVTPTVLNISEFWQDFSINSPSIIIPDFTKSLAIEVSTSPKYYTSMILQKSNVFVASINGINPDQWFRTLPSGKYLQRVPWSDSFNPLPISRNLLPFHNPPYNQSAIDWDPELQKIIITNINNIINLHSNEWNIRDISMAAKYEHLYSNNIDYSQVHLISADTYRADLLLECRNHTLAMCLLHIHQINGPAATYLINNIKLLTILLDKRDINNLNRKTAAIIIAICDQMLMSIHLQRPTLGNTSAHSIHCISHDHLLQWIAMATAETPNARTIWSSYPSFLDRNQIRQELQLITGTTPVITDLTDLRLGIQCAVINNVLSSHPNPSFCIAFLDQFRAVLRIEIDTPIDSSPLEIAKQVNLAAWNNSIQVITTDPNDNHITHAQQIANKSNILFSARTLNYISDTNMINTNNNININTLTDHDSNNPTTELLSIETFDLESLLELDNLSNFSLTPSIFSNNYNPPVSAPPVHNNNTSGIFLLQTTNEQLSQPSIIPTQLPNLHSNGIHDFNSICGLFNSQTTSDIVRESSLCDKSQRGTHYLRRFTIKNQRPSTTEISCRKRGSCVSGINYDSVNPDLRTEVIAHHWSYYCAVHILLGSQLQLIHKLFTTTYYPDGLPINSALSHLCGCCISINLPTYDNTDYETNNIERMRISYRGLCLLNTGYPKAVVIQGYDTLPENLFKETSPTEYNIDQLKTMLPLPWVCEQFTPSNNLATIYLITQTPELMQQLLHQLHHQYNNLQQSSNTTSNM